MCRWLAYSGEPLRPSELILHPKHSLVAQSLDSPLGAETVNGDGFGFGWYPADPERQRRPGSSAASSPHGTTRTCASSPRPSSLRCSSAMCAPRPARRSSRPTATPSGYENWLFMHNGVLADFGAVKRDLTFAVDPSLYPHIQGTTDSEVLFHLALTFGLRDDPVAAMAGPSRLVESVGHEHGVQFPMQGTVAVSDGVTVWAFRYSSQGSRARCSTPPTSPRCKRCTRTSSGCGSSASVPTSWSPSR